MKKSECCCMREKLVELLGKLIYELEETPIDDFTKLRPLVDRAEALIREARVMDASK